MTFFIGSSIFSTRWIYYSKIKRVAHEWYSPSVSSLFPKVENLHLRPRNLSSVSVVRVGLCAHHSTLHRCCHLTVNCALGLGTPLSKKITVKKNEKWPLGMGSQPCHHSDSRPCLNSKIFIILSWMWLSSLFKTFCCSPEDQSQHLLHARQVFYH